MGHHMGIRGGLFSRGLGYVVWAGPATVVKVNTRTSYTKRRSDPEMRHDSRRHTQTTDAAPILDVAEESLLLAVIFSGFHGLNQAAHCYRGVSLRASPLTSHHMALPLPASMITWKFPEVSPFVVNEGFLLISIIAYAIMCIGFPLMVIFIVDYKDFRDSTLFQLLSAWVFLAVIVAPIGLGCVVHTPAEYQWIGYGIIGLTACVVFFTGFGEYIVIWYKKLKGKRTITVERAAKAALKMKKVEFIYTLEDATTNEEPLTRTFTCWWSMVYSFLGIYTMTDAPQIATVKLSFLENFLLKLRVGRWSLTEVEKNAQKEKMR
ncbi:hypothetical protein Tco_1175792 [Tanacetum coccineum]